MPDDVVGFAQRSLVTALSYYDIKVERPEQVIATHLFGSMYHLWYDGDMKVLALFQGNARQGSITLVLLNTGGIWHAYDACHEFPLTGAAASA